MGRSAWSGYVAMIVSVYPTIRDNPDLNNLVESYPEALKAFIAFGGQFDFTSAAGYLGSELFSFMFPALFLVASVGNGAGAIAGEEERGTLDLLLSDAALPDAGSPLEKLGAMCVEVVGLGLVLWLALWIGARAFSHGGLGRAPRRGDRRARACWRSPTARSRSCSRAATGRKGLAVGVTVALAVAAYLVNSLAALVDVLEPFQKISPFYHYAAGDPLHQGLDPWHTLFLVAVGAAAAVAGVVLFGRARRRA